MRMARLNAFVVLMALMTGAEWAAAQQQAAPPPAKFKMTTTAFNDGDWIPLQYTCGMPDGFSPGLQWTDPPQGTMSFALILHDTDAGPGQDGMDVTHWILWNIPSSATQLPADVKRDTSPDGIQQGKNVRGINGYQPPCPPAAVTPVGVKPHHYVFDLYALDKKLDLPAGASRADLLKAMDGHVIGKASYTGIFGQGIDDKTWRWEIHKLP